MLSGVLPSDWLSVNIIPVLKKGDEGNPSNYRPISLTIIWYKIMEHIIYHSIMEHLENYNILCNYQYGFRQGHSSETQLITVEDILYAMDHHQQVDLIFVKHLTPCHNVSFHLMGFIKPDSLLDCFLAHYEKTAGSHSTH